MAGMSPARRRDLWYLPGRFYDFALGGVLRGFRERIVAAVDTLGLHPWLDICCGTGSQLRKLDRGLGRGTGIGLDLSRGMIRYASARAPDRSFVRSDAALLPFKAGSFRSVTVSFGLHEKSPLVRRAIMDEAKRVLAEEGRLIAVDFENPGSFRSRIGALVTQAVERLAGGDHYRNGREFLRRGGLTAFLRESGFVEVSRQDVESGSISLVISRVADR
jgi:ubiquinone/menaquinone biosynthesis C-methylase UbiE